MTYSGAEATLVQLATRLKNRGWTVWVVSMRPPEAYEDELHASQIPISSLGMKRGIPDIRAIGRFVALLRQWKPQIVHSHMVHANLLARASRILYPFAVYISTAHNIDEGGRLREWLYRLTDPLAHVTTNVSQAAVDRYIQIGAVPRNKIRFIPNGVDTCEFHPSAFTRQAYRDQYQLSDAFLWLAVGRFEEAKDYHTLLLAVRLLQDENIKLQLLLVGHGSLEDDIRSLLNTLQLSECVRILGIRKDVNAWMATCDGYVMSSLWEGMPLVLLEAAASECPIVATDVGGNCEVVRDGVTGYLVPPKNPSRLAQAMKFLMNLSCEERKQLGRQGRDLVSQYYDYEVITPKWESLYLEFVTSE